MNALALSTHLHTVHIAYSERLPTRLTPLAERTCFSQVSPPSVEIAKAVRAGYIPRYFISHEHRHLERAARLGSGLLGVRASRACLAGGQYVIKRQYLSKRARKQL